MKVLNYKLFLLTVIYFFISNMIFSDPINSVFEGTVWFSNKRAANATVTVETRGGSSPQIYATTTTDENGYFYFVLPSKNLYSVIAEKDGYISNGHSFFRHLKPAKVYNVSMTINLGTTADELNELQDKAGIFHILPNFFNNN